MNRVPRGEGEGGGVKGREGCLSVHRTGLQSLSREGGGIGNSWLVSLALRVFKVVNEGRHFHNIPFSSKKKNSRKKA